MNKKGFYFGVVLVIILSIATIASITYLLWTEMYYDFKVRPKCLELDDCEQYRCLADNAHFHNQVQTYELKYHSCLLEQFWGSELR